MGYEYKWRARSSSIDETNQIYFPELFRHIDEKIEELLEQVDNPIYRLIADDGFALPVVRAEADYVAPIAFGDQVNGTIFPELGDSSVRFQCRGAVGNDRVFKATVVRVFVDLETFEKKPLPESLREELAIYTEK